MAAIDPGPDYCFQCGGDHPISAHDYGRVIKVRAPRVAEYCEECDELRPCRGGHPEPRIGEPGTCQA